MNPCVPASTRGARVPMQRTRSTEALILRTNRIGEIHRGVVMLTPGDGLIRAIAHGAGSARGKLRGTTVPFCLGRAYLYTNPVSRSTKVTDMDAAEFFTGIRSDLKKYYTASLWAELVLKTFASGGAAAEVFDLMRDALRELDCRRSSDADTVSVQFLWRFLRLAGSGPDLEHCACSGEALDPGAPAWYSRAEEGFCAEGFTNDESIQWSPGILAFFRHANALSLSDALKVVPPAGSVSTMKRVLYVIVQDLVEAPLNTIRTGAGII